MGKMWCCDACDNATATFVVASEPVRPVPTAAPTSHAPTEEPTDGPSHDSALSYLRCYLQVLNGDG